jgi:hypothetical protein
MDKLLVRVKPDTRVPFVLIAVLCVATAAVATQEQVQFVVAARNADGQPVTDLMRDEIVMRENGVANEIVKVEPFHLPVKLTIAVDNGILSRDALGHYRTGLDALIKALPADMEVAIISTAPQPRFVVTATTDRAKLLKGVTSFAPEEATPRFTDALVEYSKRLQDDFKKTKRLDSLPVLLLVSTTSAENSSYEAQQIRDALNFLATRKTRIYATMTTTMQGAGATQPQQASIAIPLTKATRGRYEAIASSARLATLLPEYGADIAALHTQHNNQLLVTAARQQGLKGQLQDPRVVVTRPNVTAALSLDGLP